MYRERVPLFVSPAAAPFFRVRFFFVFSVFFYFAAALPVFFTLFVSRRRRITARNAQTLFSDFFFGSPSSALLDFLLMRLMNAGGRGGLIRHGFP
jgi:hypothetical protein